MRSVFRSTYGRALLGGIMTQVGRLERDEQMIFTDIQVSIQPTSNMILNSPDSFTGSARQAYNAWVSGNIDARQGDVLVVDNRRYAISGIGRYDTHLFLDIYEIGG